ncbi:hypothetical protein [Streptomyces fragilis]|uniref:Uncharacterized protein n=1 Tax=Streptomyces fragilis TaxID=67301 RepID=A0ABV2YEG9_9ACTN|nr:hypothetical protein [Streptomyces fragilis]
MAHLPIPSPAEAAGRTNPGARRSTPGALPRERVSAVHAWTHVMAALLLASRPDDGFGEADRVELARQLTGGWPPYRELLLARTPALAAPTTRAAYARRLLALKAGRPGDPPVARPARPAARIPGPRAEARRNGLL